MSDSTGTTTYEYDALNRLTSVTFPGPQTVAYTYDDLPGGSAADYPSQRTKITYPDAKTVEYTYDEAGNLETVTDWLSNVTTYNYDAAGRLDDMLHPNGLSTNYGYDAASRLRNVINEGPAGTLSSFTYELDAVGNREAMTDLTGTHDYVYDELFRLRQVTYPDLQSDTYTYDDVGNRLTLNAISYEYDAADQLLSDGTFVFTYDANGNQTARSAAGDSRTFAYDHENRLTQSTIGGVTSTHTYNGDGLRMSQTAGGNTTDYTWDVASGLPAVLHDGENTYVYGLDLVSATDGSGEQTYFLYDGLGSTTDLTDGSGNVTASYSYDVFGALRDGDPGATDWLFTGEQRDDNGLYYLRARYYDPEIGRFLTRDPLTGSAANPLTQNRYAYVGNNPANLVDPLGLCGWTDPLDCGDDAIDKTVGTASDVAEAGAGAARWAGTQAANNASAAYHYVGDVYHRPSTFPQETIGLGFAWTSFGDYHRESGVGWWENCWGACSWLKLSDAFAFAMGRNVFSERELNVCERVHELVHVSQSDKYGASWLPRYFWELVQHGGGPENKYEAPAYGAADQCYRSGKE